ncbi:MAG: stage II sporulation protein P [Clostridiales bacterium]|nr:stage II sporulation protein P [Clostridiales bacterium]
MTKRRLRKEKGRRLVFMVFSGVLVLIVCSLFFSAVRSVGRVYSLSIEVCSLMLRQVSPNLYLEVADEYYEDSEETYETRTESTLTYESVLAQNVPDEEAEESDDGNEEEEEGEEETTAASVTVSLEKLADYDYLIQNYYTVDSSTTISSDQLNASELLGIDCSIAEGSGGEPQILIYHTHASEGYSDSVAGDASTTVVGVGEELTRILEDTYGYTVLHDTGVYDSDRNRAYSVAKPYIEQILEDNPSIEVVIDLHRDGVSSDTRLVTEQDGVSMAQVMFFNGLSRTTSLGDISYLENPYITENLAFSLQMKLAAEELYPGFSRKIYLKGYRYNMHLMPKSLLVEVGAQTNTLEEAMNAMEPLAAVLDQVLSGG